MFLASSILWKIGPAQVLGLIAVSWQTITRSAKLKRRRRKKNDALNRSHSSYGLYWQCHFYSSCGLNENFQECTSFKLLIPRQRNVSAVSSDKSIRFGCKSPASNATVFFLLRMFCAYPSDAYFFSRDKGSNCGITKYRNQFLKCYKFDEIL